MTPDEQNKMLGLQNALAPFAALAADTDYSQYPADAVIRCEVTAGELLAAIEAMKQTNIDRAAAAAPAMLQLLRDMNTESISWLDRRDAVLAFVDGEY